MGSKAYSRAQMAEAIALAAVVGAEDAATRLGMQPRTVRRWSERAGTTPADAILHADWVQLANLARAQVQSDLLAGKVRAKDAAVIAAIAERNTVRVQEAPLESAVDARDAFLDWAEAETGDTADALLPELLRRANEEDGQPHRRAMLAWFSSRPEIPASDVLDWAKEETRAILAEHSSLDGLRQWQERRRAEAHEALLAQLERNAEAAPRTSGASGPGGR